MKKQEKGQVLVLLAIIILGILAFGALLIDGGNAFVNRRAAQNAADAGALAGARAYCTGSTQTQAEATAIVYAEDLNRGDSGKTTVSFSGPYVTVDTTISSDPFLAQLIGINQVEASASAASGCCPACYGTGMLPVAWACLPPVLGAEATGDCEEKVIDEATMNYYLENPTKPDGTIWPELYIIHDSEAQDDDPATLCAPPHGTGTLICDIDDPPDGDIDLLSGGHTGWVNLNGMNLSNADLKAWMEGNFNGTVGIHYWLGSMTGGRTASYLAAIKGLFVVPIYDGVCKGAEPNENDASDPCVRAVHDPPYVPPVDIVVGAGPKNYYHIAGFGAFYITCVMPNKDKTGDCPGYTQAVTVGAIKHNVNTIEGYFVNYFPEELEACDNCTGGDSLDVGAYILELTK